MSLSNKNILILYVLATGILEDIIALKNPNSEKNTSDFNGCFCFYVYIG